MSHTESKRTVAVVLAVALLGSVAVMGLLGGSMTAQQTANQTGGEQTQDTTYVRFVHASPDAPPVDVYVDDRRLLSGVEYGAVSDYVGIESGSHTITVTTAGDNQTVVFAADVSFEARSASTLYATGEVGENASSSFELARFVDNAFTPGEEESAISVVHLSPDAPTVDVTAANGSVVVADDLGFRNASEYVTVPPGNYTLAVREATEGNDGPVLTTVDVTTEGGTAYSALTVGYLDSETAPADAPFDVALIEDASMTLRFPGEEPPEVVTDTRGNETTDGTNDTETVTETASVNGTEPTEGTGAATETEPANGS